MNQKETKQVVETQESKEKMVVLKRSPKWWIGMAAVGGLLVGAGSGFGVGVIASQSSNNQQFSQPVQTGQNQGSNQQRNSQNGHASQGNQQNGGPQDGGPQGGGPQGGGQGQGGPQGRRTWSDATRRQWWPTRKWPDNGMNQSGGQEGNQGSSKKSNKKNSKNKNKTSDSQSNKENTTNS